MRLLPFSRTEDPFRSRPLKPVDLADFEQSTCEIRSVKPDIDGFDYSVLSDAQEPDPRWDELDSAIGIDHGAIRDLSRIAIHNPK